MKTKILGLILLLSLLLSCTSCGISASAEELSKDYERKATDAGEVSKDFKAAMADFSVALFQGLITKDQNNDLISPLSAMLCLAMIANGADGETKSQLEDALGMEVDALNEALYAFTASLYRADDCKVNLADSIWFRNDENRLKVNEAFLQANADWYDAQIYAAPFDDTTLRDINAWCKKYTDGMIDKMIDQIDGGALMYLVNALSFDAKWETQYESDDVSDRDFTNYDGTSSRVKMLSSDERFYLSGEGVKGFSKNYAGGKYSFVALLPDEETDLYDYVASLDGEGWQDLWNSRERASVIVKMPEFTYSASMNLNRVLQEMGAVDMFGENADFSKIGSSPQGNLYVSEVCQKTFIQVDRNGTKAAAITWGSMKATSAGPSEVLTVILDRPFVYAIVDNASGMPLFLGAVTSL